MIMITIYSNHNNPRENKEKLKGGIVTSKAIEVKETGSMECIVKL